MSSLLARLRAEAGNKFEESLEQLLDEAANRIEALENWQSLHRGDVMSLNTEVEQCRLENEQLSRELEELTRLRPQPTDDKINEAFKPATQV